MLAPLLTIRASALFEIRGFVIPHFGWRFGFRGSPSVLSFTMSCEYVLTESLQTRSFIPLLLTLGAALFGGAPARSALVFQTNDIVSFLGAADVVAAQQSGHLESLLAIACRGKDVRFRNLAWEGDTVFEQPRDFGFPSLLSTVQKTSATSLIMQYCRAE